MIRLLMMLFLASATNKPLPVPPAPAIPMLPAVTEIKKELKIEKHELTKEIALVRYVEYSTWSYGKSRKSEESKLDSNLVQAIKAYTGPVLKISSGKRHNGYKKSLHRCGKAIDASYCRKVVKWLLSPQGKEWALNNNVQWYIEDTRRRDLPHFRVIPWASGLHLHLEIHDH